MKQVIGIPYGDHELQRLDLYLPDCDNFSLFVYFHGGGMEKGDKSRESEIAAALCDMGVAVINANYRMYPEAKYPDFVEDAASVVAWAFAHIGAYGTCDKIYAGGSSAGGYLTMMLCFDKNGWRRMGLILCSLRAFITMPASRPRTLMCCASAALTPAA